MNIMNTTINLNNTDKITFEVYNDVIEFSKDELYMVLLYLKAHVEDHELRSTPSGDTHYPVKRCL